MGYHDLNPISFLTSEAVRDTNTAEDAAMYELWLRMAKEKIRAMSKDTAPKVNSDIAISTSISESISGNF